MTEALPLHTGQGTATYPVTVLVLLAAAAMPWLLPRRSRRRAPRWWWCAGIVVLGIAVLPPLEHLAERSLGAHMTQHVLLLFVVAPLLVAGEQLTGLVRSLPAAPRSQVASTLASLRRVAHRPATIVAVAALHAAVVLLWHLPAAYEAAGESEVLHALEHGQFLGAGVLFWWSVREVARRRRPAELAAAAGALFLVTGSGVALGLFMTFSGHSWYPSYPGLPAWGLSALEDQQVAGAVMWGAGGPAYLVAALLLFGDVIRTPSAADDALRPPPTYRPAP